MQIRNATPHAHLVYSNEDARARLFNILIVKQSFHLNADFQLCASPEQEPLNFSDLCYEDFNTSSLRCPSDLVPFKPCGEITVIADAFAPGGHGAETWTCGVEINGAHQRLAKQVRVYGKRQWHPAWTLGKPEPVNRVPIRYEHAFGGMTGADDAQIPFEQNPLGTGWIDAKSTDRSRPIPAPQLELAGAPIESPFATSVPAGLGPIPPAWLPRRPLGGTYDDAWVNGRWPHWPLDYDFAYHLSAPKDQHWTGFFQGDEVLRFDGLRPEAPSFTVTLPGQAVFARFRRETGDVTIERCNLDTIYVDLLADDPEDCLITLSWRLCFLESGMSSCTVFTGSVAMSADAAPHPDALFTQGISNV